MRTERRQRREDDRLKKENQVQLICRVGDEDKWSK